MDQFIVITEKFSSEALIKLKNANIGHIEKIPQNLSPQNSLGTNQDSGLKNFLPQATGLIIRSKTKITTELLNQAPHLKFIITCTSGFDHIDLAETRKRDITVMYTPDANSQSAAELTWSLVLATHRPLLEAHKSIKAGLWNRELLQGQELAGKNYGIVGLGRIGQKVLKFAQAFGLNVVVFDPYQDDEVFKHYNVERSSYEELLKQSDIISFHVPLTRETKNMLNKSHFEYLNRDCVLINTSRGSVINEDDLIEAIENNLVKAAGLDVFTKEPLPRDSKLLKSSKVILTQHIGALTEQAFLKASLEASSLCIDYIKNNKIKNSLPLNNEWESLMFND